MVVSSLVSIEICGIENKPGDHILPMISDACSSESDLKIIQANTVNMNVKAVSVMRIITESFGIPID